MASVFESEVPAAELAPGVFYHLEKGLLAIVPHESFRHPDYPPSDPGDDRRNRVANLLLGAWEVMEDFGLPIRSILIDLDPAPLEVDEPERGAK